MSHFCSRCIKKKKPTIICISSDVLASKSPENRRFCKSYPIALKRTSFNLFLCVHFVCLFFLVIIFHYWNTTQMDIFVVLNFGQEFFFYFFTHFLSSVYIFCAQSMAFAYRIPFDLYWSNGFFLHFVSFFFISCVKNKCAVDVQFFFQCFGPLYSSIFTNCFTLLVDSILR